MQKCKKGALGDKKKNQESILYLEKVLVTEI